MPDITELTEVTVITRTYLNRLEHLAQSFFVQVDRESRTPTPAELEQSVAIVQVYKDCRALMSSIDSLWQAADRQ